MKRSLAWCCALAASAAVAGLVSWRPVSAATRDRTLAIVYPIPPAGTAPAHRLQVNLANVSRAHADSSRTTFERTKRHVNIASIGHVDLRDPALSFNFFADISFGPNRPASGGMQFFFADGSVRFYAPVAGMLLEGKECLVFLLNRLPSGELDPTEPAIAVVREDPERRGVIFLKLQLKQVFPQTLHFEVPGDIRRIPTRGVQPHAHPWFSLHYRPQRVTVEGTDLVAGFSAWARVRRDHRANGYVALGLPDGQPPFRFEPLFATVVPETETGPGYIVILMALHGAPLQIENLAIGTVHADPDVPGCDIWDFTSNTVANTSGSPFHIVFHAEGEIRFAHGRAGSHPSPPVSDSRERLSQ